MIQETSQSNSKLGGSKTCGLHVGTMHCFKQKLTNKKRKEKRGKDTLSDNENQMDSEIDKYNHRIFSLFRHGVIMNIIEFIENLC